MTLFARIRLLFRLVTDIHCDGIDPEEAFDRWVEDQLFEAARRNAP